MAKSKQFKALPGNGHVKDLSLNPVIKDKLLDWGVQWIYVLVTIPVSRLQQQAKLSNSEIVDIRLSLLPFGKQLAVDQSAPVPSKEFVPGTFADIDDTPYLGLDQPDGNMLGHS